MKLYRHYFYFNHLHTLASSPPTIAIATPLTTSIHLSWTQQDDDYIERFEITYSYQGPCSSRHPGPFNMPLNDNTTREYTVTGLEEFSDYTITITALNRAGRSQTNITVKTLTTLRVLRVPHCRSSDTPAGVGGIGEWFFPNGSSVNNEGSGDDIYQSRGPRFINLWRRNNAQTTGVFRCQVPDASGTNQQLYVGVYPVGNSGSPSITGLLYNRSTLTLTHIV